MLALVQLRILDQHKKDPLVGCFKDPKYIGDDEYFRLQLLHLISPMDPELLRLMAKHAVGMVSNPEHILAVGSQAVGTWAYDRDLDSLVRLFHGPVDLSLFSGLDLMRKQKSIFTPLERFRLRELLPSACYDEVRALAGKAVFRQRVYCRLVKVHDTLTAAMVVDHVNKMAETESKDKPRCVVELQGLIHKKASKSLPIVCTALYPAFYWTVLAALLSRDTGDDWVFQAVRRYQCSYKSISMQRCVAMLRRL